MTLPWSDPSHLLDEGERQTVERQWLTVCILWGSILAALAVYIIIANIVGPEEAVAIGGEPDDPAWLVHVPRYVMGAMSLGLLVAAFVIRRAAGNPKGLVGRFTGAYLNAVIVAWALCESVGIFGLVNFFIEGEFLWLYIFVGVAAAALILLRPRKRELIELAVSSKSKKDF